MQFGKFSVFFLLGASFAAPVATGSDGNITKRNARTVDDELRRLDSTVNRLSREFDTRNLPRRGNARDEDDFVNRVIRGLDSLTKELRTATDNIRYSRDSISAAEMIPLANKITAFQNNLNTSINGLIKVKPIVDASRQTRAVQGVLQRASREGSDFAQAVISKLPSGVKGVSQVTLSGFTQALDRGVRAYAR
jgi:sugar-specific transcriptional regulator TrmB